MIADQTNATGIAGVMGGEESEITESTTTVMFEIAAFDRTNIRLTTRALGLRTEASGRYERGVCAATCREAADRACQLVNMLGAGEVIDGIIDVDNSDPNHKRLPFEPDKMNALLGLDLSAEEQKKLLEKLDFQIENNEVVVPFFRTDINRMCDVAEEVARMLSLIHI